MFFEIKEVHVDDRDFVKQFAKATNTTIAEAFKMDELQTVLTKRNEKRVSALAIPEGTRRGAAPARDDVDYWIAKGELPADSDLRRKVVMEKVKRAKHSGRQPGRSLLPVGSGLSREPPA